MIPIQKIKNSVSNLNSFLVPHVYCPCCGKDKLGHTSGSLGRPYSGPVDKAPNTPYHISWHCYGVIGCGWSARYETTLPLYLEMRAVRDILLDRV